MSEDTPTNLGESTPVAAPERGGYRRVFRPRILLLLLCLAAIGVAAVGVRWWRHPQRHFERGLAALESGDLGAVRREIALLDGSAEYAPHRHFLRGSLLLKQGHLADAVDEFDVAIRHPDLQVDSLILTGQAFYQMGRAGGAQSLWRRALELKPDAADAHRWMGVLYYDLGAMHDALAHLKRVAELDPTDPRPDRLMGLINKDYERFEKAVGHYRETLRRDPEQNGKDDVLMELAESEVKLHHYASALGTLERCPPNARKLALEAECHFNLGDSDTAHALLDQTLSRAPDDLPALLLRGMILRTEGDIQGAVDALSEAVHHHPKDYRVHYNLAQACRQLGDEKRADEHTAAAEELRKLWRRFSDLHLVAVDEPVNADLRFQIGQIALKLDRPDLARTWLHAALVIDPTHAEALKEMRTLDSMEVEPSP